MTTPGRPTAAGAPGPTFGSSDIIYTLLRHRWLVLVLSFLGLAGAGIAVVLDKPIFESEADLLIKYVIDNRGMGADGPESAIRTTVSGGDSVLNSEIGLATSLDLARDVAEAVGPTNVVKQMKPGADPLLQATFAIRKGLEVTVLPKSGILSIRFQHADPIVARAVLTNLVSSYLTLHSRVHRSMEVLADLQREADQRRKSIEEYGAEIRRIKSELKVASLEDAQRTYQEEIAKTRSEISGTETMLAEKRASLAMWETLAGKTARQELAATNTNTNLGAATNVALAPVPPPRLAEYRSLRARIDELSRKEQALLTEYTEVSPFVQAVRQRLAAMEESRSRMEKEFPGLMAVEVAPARGVAESPSAMDRIPTPAIEIPALEAKLKTLSAQLEMLRGEAMKFDEREEQMESLMRRKKTEENRYSQLMTSIGQFGVDQTIAQDRSSNIKVIQHPTPAVPSKSRIAKTAGALAGGGIGLGLILAFAWELFADQSIRRRAHVESSLRVPLFLTVPRLRLESGTRLRALPPPKAPNEAPDSSSGGEASGSDSKFAVPATTPGHAVELIPEDPEFAGYVEALRDRLIMHFEATGVDHKPKLVGITSCGHGAGVTTLAASLAESLSETGDGNVLYVDMNPNRGPSLHPFRKGAPSVALANAFDNDARAAAQVQENLYVVSIADAVPGTRRVGVVPKTLAALMPKMKASDYDYIIFDFPPVTQTSVTSKVAALLDMTFLVLESERTQLDLAKSALNLMGEGRTKVTAILNKHQRYLPRRLDPDI